MLYVAVCEDSLSQMAQINEYLKSYQAAQPERQLRIELFKSAEELLLYLQDGRGFDVYLLDILLPGMDGIVLSRELRSKGHEGVIIFLTSTREYAFEAFGVRAVDYLLKPVDATSLFSALDHAIALLNNREQAAYVLVKSPQGDRIVNLNDIVSVEVQGHTLCYTLVDGELLKSKVLRVSFTAATQQLMDDGRFMKPHQSFLINADHVVGVSPQKFCMVNHVDVPISRLRYTEVKNQYMAYMAQRREKICR